MRQLRLLLEIVHHFWGRSEPGELLSWCQFESCSNKTYLSCPFFLSFFIFSSASCKVICGRKIPQPFADYVQNRAIAISFIDNLAGDCGSVSETSWALEPLQLPFGLRFDTITTVLQNISWLCNPKLLFFFFFVLHLLKVNLCPVGHTFSHGVTFAKYLWFSP